jgi:hypothetical protein
MGMLRPVRITFCVMELMLAYFVCWKVLIFSINYSHYICKLYEIVCFVLCVCLYRTIIHDYLIQKMPSIITHYL